MRLRASRVRMLRVQLLGALAVEVQAFLLIHSLNLPPESPVNKIRLFLLGCTGLPAISESYVFLSKPGLRIGQNLWLMVALITAEALLVVKHGRHLFVNDMPPAIWRPWITTIALLAAWTYLFFTRGGPQARREALQRRLQRWKRQQPGALRRFLEQFRPETPWEWALVGVFAPLLPLLRGWQWAGISLPLLGPIGVDMAAR